MLEIQVINITLSLATSVIALLVAARAWKQRRVQGALWFTGLVAAVSWVTWWYTFEAAVGTDINAYVSLSMLEYIGLTFIPFFWLGFALNFTGREHSLSLLSMIVLAAIPIVTIALVFTNDFHGLIWKQPRFDMTYGAPVFEPEYGLWFWVYVVYAYVIFLFSSIVLVRYALRTWRLYRLQTLLILVGTTLPWMSNLINIFDSLNPFPYLYLNAVFLGTGILCFAFALFRLRLLDVAPLAYDTILNNVPDGIIVVDLQDRVLAINSNVKPFLDDIQQDPIGQPLAQVFSRYAAYFDGLKSAANHNGEFQVDNRILETGVSPLLDRRGKKRGRLFIISDVTAKAQAEKVQQSEQRFSETMQKIGSTLNSSLDTDRVLSLILESLDQLVPHSFSNIMQVDEDGFTLRVCQQRGYSPEQSEILGAMVFDYRTFPLFLKSAETGIPFVVPDVHREPGWIYVEGLEASHSFASMPILMDNKLFGFINIDSHEREAMKPEMVSRLQLFAQQAALAIKNARLYEQSYQQTEELQRRVNSLTITQQVYKEIGFSLNIHLLLGLVLDATLRISAADAGYIALGNSDELKIGQQYGNYELDQLHSILRDQAGILGQTITERRRVVIQGEAPLVSGLADVQAQVALPLLARGEVEADNFYGVIVLETQHTDRFTEDRMQLLDLVADRMALALHNVRLMTTVRERAAELETLYGKVSYLEKFKSDMIRIAAHDLKNPLNVIRNYITMLIDSSEFELDLDRVYPAMLSSSERMLQIIQNFLSLDRIERAAEQQTLVPFDLCKVVSKAVDEFANRAAQKSHQLQTTIPDDACIVKGDAAQVYEALSNFLSNAIKYTPQGGHISVSLAREDNVARLEITDNGYGIPEAQQAKLFQPFYRAQSPEIVGIDGSGLGLHLTKNIIERQGGKIIFRSVYQQGSTFGFEMPVYQAESTEYRVPSTE